VDTKKHTKNTGCTSKEGHKNSFGYDYVNAGYLKEMYTEIP